MQLGLSGRSSLGTCHAHSRCYPLRQIAVLVPNSADLSGTRRLQRQHSVKAAAGRPRKSKASEPSSEEPVKRKSASKKKSSADISAAEDEQNEELPEEEEEERAQDPEDSESSGAEGLAAQETEGAGEETPSQPEEEDVLTEGEAAYLAELEQDEEEDLELLQVLTDEELESRQYQDPEFLPTTRSSPLLSNREVWERMLQATSMASGSENRAFYSSDLGGIVTHPALMVVAIDDHMVHRGHAVFDTAHLTQGYVYQLRQHLERLADSAQKAGLTSPISMPQMERIVLETAAASRLLNGSIRFWLSAGRGDFSLSPGNCSPSFYCIVFVPPKSVFDEIGDGVEGMRVKTSPLPPKHDYFATLKSTNYLHNALALMDAQDNDMDQVGHWL